MVRGRGVSREKIEHLLAIADAAAGLDLVPEHDLLAGIVQRRGEPEVTFLHRSPREKPLSLTRVRAQAIGRRLLVGRCDRPSGERAGHGNDVLLGVAAVHAECVQFEQLASVVFVQALPAPLGRLRLRVVRRSGPGGPLALQFLLPFGRGGIGAQPVIQIEEHRRALCRSFQQVAEFAEHVRADRVRS